MKEKIKAFIERHKEVWKFIKFAFTGASTSILQSAVYMICLYGIFRSLNDVSVDNPVLKFLGVEYMGYMWSYFVSAVIGYAAAYIMNRKLTFKSDANPLVSTILYAIMVVFTIVVTTWMNSALGTFIKERGWDNAIVELIIQLIVMTVPTLWTYPLSRFVIHRKKKED